MRVLLVGALVGSLCGLVGCRRTKPTPTPPVWPVKPQPSKTAVDLTGEWLSEEWGVIELQQRGSEVTGEAEASGRRLQGTLSGDRLELKWWHGARSHEEAQADDRGEGYVTVEHEGDALEGQWRKDGETDWSGRLRFARRVVVSQTGTLDVPAKFEGEWHDEHWGTLKLAQTADKVRGTYRRAGDSPAEGIMDGVVEEGVFRFAWWEGAETYEDADIDHRGEGEFGLQPDGSLKGRWGYDDTFSHESFPKLGAPKE